MPTGLFVISNRILLESHSLETPEALEDQVWVLSLGSFARVPAIVFDAPALASIIPTRRQPPSQLCIAGICSSFGCSDDNFMNRGRKDSRTGGGGFFDLPPRPPIRGSFFGMALAEDTL